MLVFLQETAGLEQVLRSARNRRDLTWTSKKVGERLERAFPQTPTEVSEEPCTAPLLAACRFRTAAPLNAAHVGCYFARFLAQP